MTQTEFNETNWHRGNVVKLDNGKEYFLKGTKGHGKYLLLYSEEYETCFVADFRIVDCRTSDYEEPDEVYLEKKRKRREALEALREAERQAFLQAKLERKLRNLQEQERIHQEALARKAAKKLAQEQKQAAAAAIAKQKKVAATVAPEPKKVAATVAPEPKNVAAVTAPEATEEKPKRVRKRITIKRPVKVDIK